jgi:hypothetical protein
MQYLYPHPRLPCEKYLFRGRSRRQGLGLLIGELYDVLVLFPDVSPEPGGVKILATGDSVSGRDSGLKDDVG